MATIITGTSELGKRLDTAQVDVRLAGMAKHGDTIAEASTEMDRLAKALMHCAEDWADDHTHLQDLCIKAGIPADEVHGDSYGVPGIQELSNLLAAKIDQLQQEKHRLLNAR
jgi:hypothetical protein